MDTMWAVRKRRRREGAQQHPRPCSPTPLPPLWPVLLFWRLDPFCLTITCHGSSKSKAFSYFKVTSWYHPTPQFQLPAIKEDSHSGCHLLSTMFSTRMSLGHYSPHTWYTFFPLHLVFPHRQHHHPSVMQTWTQESWSPLPLPLPPHPCITKPYCMLGISQTRSVLSQYHLRPNDQHLLPTPGQLPTAELGSSNQTSTKPEGLPPPLPSLSPTSL